MPHQGTVEVRPPLPLAVYVRKAEDRLPFPFGAESFALFARGRHALWQGVQALGLQPGDGVLVPELHHPEAVEALLRAGLVPRLYGGSPFEPNERELNSLANGARAVLIVHHLGFPQDGGAWRAWCDERGILLLEDAAHAWLANRHGSPVGSHGDLAFFSIYKSFGLSDGAVLTLRAAAPGPETRRPLGIVATVRQHRLLATPGAEDGYHLGDPGSAPSAATLFLLPRLDTAAAIVRRRGHYAYLLEEFGELVPAAFQTLPEGAVPWALPLENDAADGLGRRLSAAGFATCPPWGLGPHPSLLRDASADAAAGRNRVIGIPVHQELGLRDLERLSEAIRPAGRRLRSDLRLEPIRSFEEVGEQWDELARRSRNVFGTREWLELWWRHFGREKRLMLTACRSAAGELVAILPLYAARHRRLRVIRLLGHGTGDQLGPICAPEDRLRAARGLRKFLEAELAAQDFFLGELLPGDLPWRTFLGGRTVRRDGYPILRFEHRTWEEYAASRGRHFRKSLGRTERQLARQHEVTIRLADDPARLSSDLDALFRLHRMQWSDWQSPFAASESFHRDLARSAFDRGWLHLWFLEIDAEPVVAEYTLRFSSVQNHYQGGRDPTWDHASVGSALFTYSIRRALEDGLEECRFLRGREDYKYRYATDDPELESVGVAAGALGDAALAATNALQGHGVARLRRWLAE